MYKLYGLGIILALVGIQLDLYSYRSHQFEVLTWQHFATFLGTAVFVFTAFSRFYARRKFGMRLDRGTRLALVASCVILGSGLMFVMSHVFIEQKFIQANFLPSFSFLIGIVLASVATMISLNRTNLAFFGYMCIILTLITAFFVITIDFGQGLNLGTII